MLDTRVKQHLINHNECLLNALQKLNSLPGNEMTLFVEDDSHVVTGTLTDGDIRRAMERRGKDFFDIKAVDIATKRPKSIGMRAKLIEAEKLMTQHKVNSLLVTDDDGKLVGVVQIYDIKL